MIRLTSFPTWLKKWIHSQPWQARPLKWGKNCSRVLTSGRFFYDYTFLHTMENKSTRWNRLQKWAREKMPTIHRWQIEMKYVPSSANLIWIRFLFSSMRVRLLWCQTTNQSKQICKKYDSLCEDSVYSWRFRIHRWTGRQSYYKTIRARMYPTESSPHYNWASSLNIFEYSDYNDYFNNLICSQKKPNRLKNVLFNQVSIFTVS